MYCGVRLRVRLGCTGPAYSNNANIGDTGAEGTSGVRWLLCVGEDGALVCACWWAGAADSRALLRCKHLISARTCAQRRQHCLPPPIVRLHLPLLLKGYGSLQAAT